MANNKELFLGNLRNNVKFKDQRDDIIDLLEDIGISVSNHCVKIYGSERGSHHPRKAIITLGNQKTLRYAVQVLREHQDLSHSFAFPGKHLLIDVARSSHGQDTSMTGQKSKRQNEYNMPLNSKQNTSALVRPSAIDVSSISSLGNHPSSLIGILSDPQIGNQSKSHIKTEQVPKLTSVGQTSSAQTPGDNEQQEDHSAQTSDSLLYPWCYHQDTYIHGQQLASNETRNLEFKCGQGASLQKQLGKLVGKYMSAFLNSQGGTLLVGVGDSGEANHRPNLPTQCMKLKCENWPPRCLKLSLAIEKFDWAC